MLLAKRGIKRYRYDYLFNLIEKGENKKVHEFFKDFPELINKIVSQHDWTPVMYACRYGNFELLKIFSILGFKIDQNNVTSLLHLTCYSENMRIIEYLLNQINLSPIEITSLLRISAILTKQEITLFFMVNGGLCVDNSLEHAQYINVYPNKTLKDGKVDYFYFSVKQDLNLTNKVLRVTEQKKNPGEILKRVLPFARKYKFELVVNMFRKFPEIINKNKDDEIMQFLAAEPDYCADVLEFL